MDNLPNDIYREIIKLLDSPSICNLYITHKIFQVLTKEQINYHRLIEKVSPHKHTGSLKMVSQQMIWLDKILTEASKLRLLSHNMKFNNDVRYLPYNVNIETSIDHISCDGHVGYSMFDMWMQYKGEKVIRSGYVDYYQNVEGRHKYVIIIPPNELADLIVKQFKMSSMTLDEFISIPT